MRASGLAIRGSTSLLRPLFDSLVAQDCRDRLRDVARAGRLHWRADTGARRNEAVDLISALDVSHLVAVVTPINRTKQERPRRLALNRLLWELTQLGVADVLIESRASRSGDRGDARDRALILGQQRSQALPPKFRYAFGLPLQESLLWLPDVVAGAVGQACTGQDRGHFEALQAKLTVIDVQGG